MKNEVELQDYNEQKPVRREVTDEIQKVLDEYLEDNKVETLEKEMNERIAHVIDVIFKESVRTFDELKGNFDKGEPVDGMFCTPYELFDEDKVFFNQKLVRYGKNNEIEEDWTFGYPITVWKRGEEHILKTNWVTHNFLYKKPFEVLDDNGKLNGYFYQDIDIFGDEDSWQKDLIKALYMVVGATYDWWVELTEEKEKIDAFLKKIKFDEDKFEEMEWNFDDIDDIIDLDIDKSE